MNMLGAATLSSRVEPILNLSGGTEKYDASTEIWGTSIM